MRLSRSSHSLPVQVGVTLIVTIAFLGVLASASHAAHVSCGDVVTEDTTLDTDLQGCAGDGIVIGADGVTLDLNQHVVAGDGDGTDSGVEVVARNNVRVTNGFVRGFFRGVNLARGAGGSVANIVVSCDHTECDSEAVGIEVAQSQDAAVIENTVVGAAFGIGVGGRNVRIERNAISGAVNGVEVEGGEGNLVARNVVENSGVGIVVVDTFSGAGHLIADNVVSRAVIGALASQATATRFIGNTIDQVRYGISVLESFGTAVDRNRVTDSTVGIEAGISAGTSMRYNVVAGSDVGIQSRGSLGDYVLRNVVRRALDIGITVGLPSSPSSQAIVVSNDVRGSGSDGIAVSAESSDTLLSRNRSRQNGDDGIDVESADTTITRNRADRNGDLGIEAVEGVIDGGGNRARGNRNPEQCTGVVCR